NSEPSSTTAPLVIDVQGEVVNPGLYEVPLGSRVGDAIKAAGGVRKGVSTSSVNLARFLEDGEQLFVAGVDQNFSPTGGAIPSSTGGGKLNLNRASESELDGLPGVGPVLAKRIIAYRNENGNFSSVDELRKVSGIGPAKFGELQSFVTV
ncbi:MAG: ComEA family DNA-binding protein, partial [Actinobacteria bacterium]|nr:ComEA family DNA-binding protein [Actinomycetota bacterium]